MAESTRSRNPSQGKNSENAEEKGFVCKLKKNSDSSFEEKANLKLKIRPLRSGNGLQIVVTKEEDASFYYCLDITEDDYRELRIRQGLFVDMAGFPAMIFRLLDNCIAEETTESPKFSPVLEYLDNRCDEVTFEIQEINLFRRLAHLSLKLRRGNDAKIRDHLAECLKSLKLEHSVSVRRLEESQNLLDTTTNEKTEILTNFEKLKREFTEKDSLNKQRSNQEIIEERNRMSKHYADLKSNFETEKNRLTENHAATLRTLENRVAALDYDNRDLTEKKHKNEAMIHR